MNHTPAPWHPHRSESGFVVVYSDGQNRSHVARLFDSTLCEEHGSLEANAHLIASAPELLSALEWLVDDWERVTNRTLPDDHEAKAAIAKAKGGAA